LKEAAISELGELQTGEVVQKASFELPIAREESN